MSKYAVFSFSNDNFIMETEESIEIADLHVRFNAYGSTIDAEGEEEEEEMVEDEEVDVDSNCRKFFPVNFWRENFLFACCCR